MRQNNKTNYQATVTRFAIGQTYITPGAEEALQIAGQTAIEFLRRHMSCDWESYRTTTFAKTSSHLKKAFDC